MFTQPDYTTMDAATYKAAIDAAVAALAELSPFAFAKNLAIQNNATNPNYQLDVSADAVLLRNGAGAPMAITALNGTLDITASGANGLDAGAEASSTWYYVHAIAKNDGTKALLLSASSSAPTMPAGYTFSAFIGAVRNDGSANFRKFEQRGHTSFFTDANDGPVHVLSEQPTPTAVSLASDVPPNATELYVSEAIVNAVAGVAGINPSFTLSPRSSGAQPQQAGFNFTSITSGQCTVNFNLGWLPNVGQQLYYTCVIVAPSAGSGPNAIMYVGGFRLPLCAS